MAQINSPKSFDSAQLSPQFIQDSGGLIDYINQQFDQLNRALLQQLTLPENMRGRMVTLSVSHNTPVTVTNTSFTGSVIYNSGSNGVKSYTFVNDSQGNSVFTFKFNDSIPILTRTVIVSSPFATYEVKNADNISPGDLVTVSGSTNSHNNGQFLVMQNTGTLLTVYNSAAVAAVLPNYVGSSESVKSVSLFLYYN